MAMTAAEILVRTLEERSAEVFFGIYGEGINDVSESQLRVKGRFRFIQTPHVGPYRDRHHPRGNVSTRIHVNLPQAARISYSVSAELPTRVEKDF